MLVQISLLTHCQGGFGACRTSGKRGGFLSIKRARCQAHSGRRGNHRSPAAPSDPERAKRAPGKRTFKMASAHCHVGPRARVPIGAATVQRNGSKTLLSTMSLSSSQRARATICDAKVSMRCPRRLSPSVQVGSLRWLKWR